MKSSDHDTSFDLIIVGGGVVGLTLANLLAYKIPALSIALLDEGDIPSDLDAFSTQTQNYDPRVMAISKVSEQIFTTVGVWEGVKLRRACAYQHMAVWDAEGTGDIHFSSDDIGGDHLGHIVENSLLVSALTHTLETTAGCNVRCFYGAKVEAFHTVNTEGDQGQAEQLSCITLDKGGVLTAKLVVAADGAKSTLRDMASFQMRQWDYGHSAIVTTVQTEKNHNDTAWQRFTSDGPLAFLPLGDGFHCSIVWSVKHDVAEAMMALDDESFCLALSRAFEYKLGAVIHADKRFSFPLTQRHAKRYVDRGIVLVGDAAHTIHPLAGQGANLGIYDVAALSDELERAVARKLPLSDASIIKRYERRRQPHNLAAMSAMEGFKRLFGADNLAVRWLRNEGLRCVNNVPWLKNQFSRVASGQT